MANLSLASLPEGAICVTHIMCVCCQADCSYIAKSLLKRWHHVSHAHILRFGFRKECGQLRVLPKASGCMHDNKDLMFGCAAMQPFRDKWPQASLFEGPQVVEDFMWQDDLIGVAILSIHVWKSVFFRWPIQWGPNTASAWCGSKNC